MESNLLPEIDSGYLRGASLEQVQFTFSSPEGQETSMYKKGFFIEEPVGNNAFSYEERPHKKIWVPSIKTITNIYDVELQDDREKIAFEDFGFDDTLSTNYGLKNFYKIELPLTSTLSQREREQQLYKSKYHSGSKESSLSISSPKGRGGRGGQKEIYLFDNHNHALYFWYEAKNKGIIGENCTLIHIDEHADMRDNNKVLSKEDSTDLQKVFEFTNFVANVGDYIVPALENGFISEVIQVRSTQGLEEYLAKQDLTLSPSPAGEGDNNNFSSVPLDEGQQNSPLLPIIEEESSPREQGERGGIILNLDLDFFQPDLDFIDYNLKKQVVLDAFSKAKVVTISTSPFFINQKLALQVFQDIFSEVL